MSKLFVAAYDLHYPKIHKPTWEALKDFLGKNAVDGFIFGGDQFDNQCISHHTKGKPRLRVAGSFKRDEDGFEKDILAPLEELLPEACQRIWITGNHDDWEEQMADEQPELEGILTHVENLEVADRGWQIIPLGHAYRLGKLNVIHGEILTGIGNQGGTYPARKAVELYASNVLAGHTHAPQSFTKISPVETVQKWQGWIAPIVGNVNPGYLKNRPTAWLNGFVVIETWGKGNFNLYPINVVDGRFTFGGVEYGRKR